MAEAKRRRLNPVIIIDRQSVLPDDLLLSILSHLNVKTLIENKRVCRTWRHTCTEAIDAKQTPTTKKAFSTNQELRKAVEKYCGYNEATDSYSQCCSPRVAEEFAQTYGYPINQWDVSSLQDFSFVFDNMDTFNEDISSWNVSNATSMYAMFIYASSFNQDMSSWNVSNVTNMNRMFGYAKAFNQDLSSWNVSNVTNMSWMFLHATAFDQDIESWELWDISKIVV
jgi:surface protein